jgi:acetylornithine deacetylase/succinyl-diaminopimelate desuccinylase-like protein
MNMTNIKFSNDDAISFLQGAIQAQSITGNESNFVSYLEPKLESLGLSPQSDEFEANRRNIWGESKASSEGRTLLIVGHTDTVHVEGWSERWKSDEREDPFCGAVVDGKIWGRGSGDLKAGICSWLTAFETLKANKVELGGKVQFAFVGDEESGEEGSGVSAGIKHYVNKIAPKLDKPDFAVYTEPSQLNIYTAQMGFFIADIKVIGKSTYFGMPEKGVDALKAANKLVSAINSYSEALAGQNNHDLVGRPFVLITEMVAGGYIAVPGEAKLSLIRKLTPLEDMDAAVEEFKKLVTDTIKNTACQVEISFPAGRDHKEGGLASVTDPAIAPVEGLQESIRKFWPATATICAAPFWSEKSFITHKLGCDAVYSAPGDISNCHTTEEHVDIDEYLAAINAYADFIAKFCGASAP